jgi:hypothetical protein
MDSMSLKDFNIDVNSLIKPIQQPLSFEELKAVAQLLLNPFVEG